MAVVNNYNLSLFKILIVAALLTGCLKNHNQTKSENYLFPLKLSKNRRFLIDQHNRNFFWSGEAAWSLIAQLKKSDLEYYLNDRKQKGFTVLLVNLIEHKFATHAPANYYGNPPFRGKPFITPNEPYFSYADYVIKAANKRGIIVLLCPLYIGWEYGNEGWGYEIKNASTSDLQRWGKYVGHRYANFKNIVWCIGADADPALQKDKVLAFIQGIREESKNLLFTAHNTPEQFAVTPWEEENWLNINSIYSYSKTLYEMCRTAYQRKPVMPYFLMESAYENEHNSSSQLLRSEAYWPLLCGGVGYIFGNCPIWNFSSDSSFCIKADWKSELDMQGSLSMLYLQKLFRSRPWYLLVPDFNHSILTEGFNKWGNEDYVTAARTSDSSNLIAYIPVQTEVAVDLSKISGRNVKCWWYNPSSGNAIEIGVFPNNNVKKFTPPVNGDWILVIDDNSRNYYPPGQNINY